MSAMICTISLLLALLLLQADQPKKDLEQLRREASEAAEKHRDEAIRLNDLAGHLKTESDAENLVDSIAKMFADELPPPWATRDVRLARAEYAAVTNFAKQIPEERVASIWNQYARAIGTSNEMIVTVPEIHSLRDLHYASANLIWANGWNQSISTIPNVYTVGPDGKIANGCRPLEALQVFHDLDNQSGICGQHESSWKRGSRSQMKCKVRTDGSDRSTHPKLGLNCVPRLSRIPSAMRNTGL